MDAEVTYLRGFSDGLEDIIKQLQALHDSSQGRAERLQLRSYTIKNGQGLIKLPNELIAHILSYAICPSQKDDSLVDGTIPRAVTLEKDVLALSHVNSRFLYVARSTPALWTTITWLYPCSMVEAFLERSGACGFRALHVHEYSALDQRDIRLFRKSLQALCRNAHRLETLVIRTREFEQQEVIHELIMDGAGPCFPRLEQLDIFCPFIDEYETGFNAATPSYGALLGTRFPSLRILSVLHYMLIACAVNALTSVHVSGLAGGPEGQIPFDVGKLLVTLGELPALRSFTLDYNCDFGFPVNLRDLASPPIALSKVRDMELHASSETSMLIVKDILQHVSLPGLEVLILDLTIAHREDDDEFDSLLAVADALGSEHHSFPQLHTLHLSRLVYSNNRIYDPRESAGDALMFSRMPGLRSVSLSHTISGNTVRLLGDAPMLVGACMLPLLESISLYNCDCLRGEEILDAIYSRQHSLDITPVKRLIVKDCSSINQHDYYDLAGAMRGYGSLEVDYYKTIVGK